MGRVIDLKGRRFGRLTVIEEAGRSKDRHVLWLCKCDCGNKCIVPSNSLKKGDTQSCGCLYKEQQKIPKSIKHGMSKSRIYQEWIDMRNRCVNKNVKCYHNYGGRGITVCEEWRDFQAFYDWAMANGYTDDLTLDRIDNNGPYSPENCRWVTYKEQGNNTSRNHCITHKGKTQTISQWADELNMKYSTLYARLSSGWSIERALSEPLNK